MAAGQSAGQRSHRRASRQAAAQAFHPSRVCGNASSAYGSARLPQSAISYVSFPPYPAEKELSLTAQRRSAEEFAARHGAVINHHYVEPGASGTDTHRAVFNELLGDALRPGSNIATIVVHHTSRFTRDATHAS
jgi:hypothetical protein